MKYYKKVRSEFIVVNFKVFKIINRDREMLTII